MALGANSNQVGCHCHAHQLLVVGQLHLHSITGHELLQMPLTKVGMPRLWAARHTDQVV